MADRYRGMRYVPRRELKRFRKDGTAEPHDDLLVELMGAIEGYHTALADRFDREAAAIKADEMLSEKGKRDKLKALAAQYRRHDDLDRHDAVIARAEKVVGELEATATANALPLDLNGLSQDGKLLALIEYANRKGRWLLKYEAAPPEKQREIVWDAIDKLLPRRRPARPCACCAMKTASIPRQ